MSHYYGIPSHPRETDPPDIPASPSIGMGLTCHPSGAALSYYHKAWVCPTIGSTPAGATSRLSHGNMPAPSRIGSRAE
eukprot:6448392-Heterocapsa_arctica.AAC.1